MATCLYLAPHLDDVALSCAGGVLARLARGDRVVVCSVFTRTRNRTMEQRRAGEDAAAWYAIGAERVDLGFDDAPDREGIPPTYTALMLGPPPRAALVRAVRAAIAAQVRRVRPDEVWFPLAIGGHVDHRAVFAAHLAVGDARFYADRPYAFVPAFVALRRAELSGTGAPHWTAPAIAEQIARGSCGAFVGEAEHDAVVAELAARLASPRTPTGIAIRARALVYPRATLPAAAAVIDRYRSQVRALFGTTKTLPIWRRHTQIRGGWFETAFALRGIGRG